MFDTHTTDMVYAMIAYVGASVSDKSNLCYVVLFMLTPVTWVVMDISCFYSQVLVRSYMP